MVVGYLIKLNQEGILNALSKRLSYDPEYFDPSHQLFVPENCVVGHYKQRDGKFVMNKEGIFYRDSVDELRKFSTSIDNKEILIVKEVNVNSDKLEKLMEDVKTYLNLREQVEKNSQILIN